MPVVENLWGNEHLCFFPWESNLAQSFRGQLGNKREKKNCVYIFWFSYTVLRHSQEIIKNVHKNSSEKNVKETGLILAQPY